MLSSHEDIASTWYQAMISIAILTRSDITQNITIYLCHFYASLELNNKKMCWQLLPVCLATSIVSETQKNGKFVALKAAKSIEVFTGERNFHKFLIDTEGVQFEFKKYTMIR